MELHAECQCKESRVKAMLWLVNAEIDLIENAQIWGLNKIVAGVDLQQHIFKKAFAVPVLVVG